MTARLPPFAMSLTAMLLLEIYALLRIENLRKVRSIGEEYRRLEPKQENIDEGCR